MAAMPHMHTVITTHPHNGYQYHDVHKVELHPHQGHGSQHGHYAKQHRPQGHTDTCRAPQLHHQQQQHQQAAQPDSVNGTATHCSQQLPAYQIGAGYPCCRQGCSQVTDKISRLQLTRFEVEVRQGMPAALVLYQVAFNHTAQR